MAEALPVPAGVPPGVVAKCWASSQALERWRPGIRERPGHTSICSGEKEPQTVLWISSLLGALSQVSSSSEHSTVRMKELLQNYWARREDFYMWPTHMPYSLSCLCLLACFLPLFLFPYCTLRSCIRWAGLYCEMWFRLAHPQVSQRTIGCSTFTENAYSWAAPENYWIQIFGSRPENLSVKPPSDLGGTMGLGTTSLHLFL